MITINAKAKINLTLDILGRRSDGYHEVSMVMQSVDLCDTLTLKKIERGIVLHGDVEGVAVPQDNLIYKAAALLLEVCDIPGGVDITLEKRIPVAAGLAGGSTDAAAALRGINELFELHLPDEELCRLAGKLGSDIPFCVLGGTMLARGRGEILSPLPAAPALPLVLVKPKIGVSTAWVYKHYHEVEDNVVHPDEDAMKNALAKQDVDGICKSLGNVLEYVTIPAHPEIEQIKRSLTAYGAKAAMMSGSGPTVFAVAESNEQAQSIADKIRADFDADVFATKTANADI